MILMYHRMSQTFFQMERLQNLRENFIALHLDFIALHLDLERYAIKVERYKIYPRLGGAL